MAHTVTEPVKLLVKLDGQGSRTIPLTGNTFTIGRRIENDLPIEDHTVSGHHAKIVKVQSVYFLEDLNSTNGTVLNGKSIKRVQLRDTDVITIGRHRIIFQDGTPDCPAPLSSSPDLDRTMLISSRDSGDRSPSICATVLVTEGKTDRLEYQLTKSASLIGSQEGAAIRLTGWFAPTSAALISCHAGSYTISPSHGTKKLLVNRKVVSSREQLKHGDVIQVAGVSMTFHLSTQ